MGSIYINDWKFGQDRRRPRASGIPGTLWNGKNVLISRGGDIERPKRWVPTFTLPAGTFGLGAVHGQPFTFGSNPDPGVPLGIQYQRLQAPSGAPMTEVLDAKSAGGSLYVIARFMDGNIFHFYNGARITDWDAVADANCDYTSLAAYMAEILNADTAVSALATSAVVTITARVPGTAFTIAKASVDLGGTGDQDITLATAQSNVPAAAETLATTAVSFLAGTSGIVTNISINSVSLMLAPVTWATNNTVTAAAIAVQINNLTATHGYTAVAVAGVITITALSGTGATPNGYAVGQTVTGDIVLSTPSMSGGVTAVAGVAQIVTATFSGTFEPKDSFTISINGTDYIATGRSSGTGVSTYVNKRRVFSAANTLWQYCRLNTFTDWSNADVSSGAGFLNISNEAEGSERLIGAGTFIQQAAVFSRRNIRVYNIDTNAANITLSQPLDNSGALSSRSILAYGTTDLFYLDETGIRSLKSRDATNLPFVNDIGVALDTFVRDHIDSLTPSVTQHACAIVEPRDGRYMLALGERIYVLSYFPGSQISAWTYLEPGFSVSDFARAYNKLYARAANTVYLYGGSDGATYPQANEMIATVDLPFTSTSPPSLQMLTGFDMAAQGAWTVSVLLDPNNETAAATVGTFNGVSYTMEDSGLPGRTTHLALSMTCAAAGAAKISNLTVRTIGKEPNE